MASTNQSLENSDYIVAAQNEIIATKKSITDTNFSVTSEVEFFHKIIANYDLDDYRTIFQLKNSDLFIACLKLYNMENNYIEISKDIQSIKEKIDKWTINDANELAVYIISVRNLSLDDDQNEAQEAKSMIKCQKIFSDDFINVIKKYDTIQSIEILYALIVAKYYCSISVDVLARKATNEKQKKAIAKRFNQEMNRSQNNFDEQTYVDFKDKNNAIRKVVKLINSHIANLKTYANTFTKQKTIVIQAYEKLIKMLEDGSINNITQLPSEIKKFISHDINRSIGLIIEGNLRNAYHNLLNENTTLESRVQNTDFRNYLLEVGLNYDTISPEYQEILYLLTDFSQVKENTKSLLSLGLKATTIFNSEFTRILPNIEANQLKVICAYKDNKIIDGSFVISYPGVLIATENQYYAPLFNLVNDNIKYLLNKKYDLNKDNWQRNILLLQNEELKYRESLLANYQIDSENTLYMLGNIDQIWLLDMLIENDIDPNFIYQIATNYDPIKTIYKIILANTIGDNIITSRGLLCKTITNYDNFYVTDCELKNSIINDVPEFIEQYKDNRVISWEQIVKLFADLDKLFLYDNVYVFGDLKIAQNKVSKIITEKTTLTNLITCFLANSIASYEQINGLVTTITNMLENSLTLSKKQQS